MTTKTIKTIVFSFAALLMLMPFAGTNAFGAEVVATAELTGICGLESIDSIDMGTITPGFVGAEQLLSISQDPNSSVNGDLEIQATDWFGNDVFGTTASGTLTLTGVSVGDKVSVNSHEYIGVSGVKADLTEFTVGIDDEETAISLADSLNNDPRHPPGPIGLTASASNNVITVTAFTSGIIGNDIAMIQISASIVPNGLTLLGGVDVILAEKHLESEVTRYEITFDGSIPPNVDYVNKNSLPIDDATLLDLGTTQIIGNVPQDIQIALQISGDGTLQNLPYSGTLSQTLTITLLCR